ncbi:hypothetical protein [Umezawaea beigongshangensis]|uniref:hypothetical protein n=1 Tax=Umezawaea beigongshangensis TaxID=2780383 RepID=UPI0018F20538|nr:hypothetical protein [Umezawaea beigongshangensis]
MGKHSPRADAAVTVHDLLLRAIAAGESLPFATWPDEDADSGAWDDAVLRLSGTLLPT